MQTEAEATLNWDGGECTMSEFLARSSDLSDEDVAAVVALEVGQSYRTEYGFGVTQFTRVS